MATSAQRNARFNLRATKRQEKLIKLAAKETHSSNVSAFVLESACLRAEETLASKQHFEIRPSQWNEFLAALDRPPQQKPNLRKLLAEPSVLDR
jgi:uncharacterized protein (DUF1778 family)